MSHSTASNRAAMPAAKNPILDRRTVENGNRNLLKYLKPGLSVLDVGCGSGAITRGIAEKVSPGGRVLGIDPSESLIARAREQLAAVPNLEFRQADLFTFDTEERFDVVTCARVLQWLAEPKEALLRMKRLLKPGGYLAVLDYNHEKIEWSPEPHAAMRRFYAAFLQWRKDAGFNNAVIDGVEELVRSIGFATVHTEDQFEISLKGEAAFATESRIWSDVAEIRGPQLVKDGYLTEDERLQAIRDYDEWVSQSGQRMQLYLRAVEAKIPDDPANA